MNAVYVNKGLYRINASNGHLQYLKYTHEVTEHEVILLRLEEGVKFPELSANMIRYSNKPTTSP